MSTVNDRCIQRAYRSETDTSTDRELWVVSVPAVDYIRQAFFGAIATLGFPESYNPISDIAAEYGSEVVESLTQIVPPEVITVPANTDVILFPPTAVVSQGNANLIQFNAVQRFATYFMQSPAAQFDTYKWTRYLAKGTWDYRITGLKANNAGILNFIVRPSPSGTAYLDVTHDFYNAATQANIVFTGSLTIPTTGKHDIVCAKATKHASSSGYWSLLSCIEMWQTG